MRHEALRQPDPGRPFATQVQHAAAEESRAVAVVKGAIGSQTRRWRELRRAVRRKQALTAIVAHIEPRVA